MLTFPGSSFQSQVDIQETRLQHWKGRCVSMGVCTPRAIKTIVGAASTHKYTTNGCVSPCSLFLTTFNSFPHGFSSLLEKSPFHLYNRYGGSRQQFSLLSTSYKNCPLSELKVRLRYLPKHPQFIKPHKNG